MRVLLTGATGFIGRHLLESLLAAGHEVVCAIRSPETRNPRAAQLHTIAADFTTDLSPAVWLPRLHGIDVVINAVGILRESGAQTFAALHVQAPQALFAACMEANVRHIVQISALGADEAASSRYHLSKKVADDFLRRLPLQWTIVQPSVIYGPGGTSARLFSLLASLPIIVLPGRGGQMLQPVHIDDVVPSVVRMLDADQAQQVARRTVALVGPEALTLKVFLGRLRAALGLGRMLFLPMPMLLMRVAARVGSLLPGSLLDTETLDMLARGNTGDPEPIQQLLGRAPKSIEDFIPEEARASARNEAQLTWLLPALRLSIALVWIITGIVCLGVYPVSESYALLARTGVTGAMAPVFLYGAAVLDLALGIATLLMRRRGVLWLVQMALIVLYTIIITLHLPEYWLHPYGPVLKNLPMLVAIYLLYQLEPRRR